MGLKLNAEDLKWLYVAQETGCETMPPYNRSRLIALGMIEMRGERCIVTELGTANLARQRC